MIWDWTLQKWNGFLSIVHWSVFIVATVLVTQYANTRNFRVPIVTHFAEWDPNTGPVDSTQKLGLFPFAYVACVIPMLSAIAHTVAYLKNKSYNNTNLYNTDRWIEYSFSSTLMFFLICLLFAIYDISTLIALSTMNASVMFCGYMMEQLNNKNQLTTSIRWAPFNIGCFIATVQWALLYSTLSKTNEQMPFLIWIALGSYFYMFLLFPLNMFSFYMFGNDSVRNFGKLCFLPYTLWYILQEFFFKCFKNKNQENSLNVSITANKFEKHEKIYMVLSLTSKNLLLWLIIFGVNQPSVYT